uniref:Putative secreted protein n=1 Tax=Anopheles darlingi TaxID=43151 RepID=A0A2M4DFN7_ANODA
MGSFLWARPSRTGALTTIGLSLLSPLYSIHILSQGQRQRRWTAMWKWLDKKRRDVSGAKGCVTGSPGQHFRKP